MTTGVHRPVAQAAPRTLPVAAGPASLGAADSRDGARTLLLVTIMAAGLALNHSSVILSVNLSAADPLVLVLTVALVLTGRMWIPTVPLVLFLIVSVQQIAVATLLAPGWTQTPLPLSGTLSDYAKLVAAFLCFLLGVQLVRLGLAMMLLRAYVAGSVAVSAIALASLAIPALHEVGDLFLGGFRFQGLTNDPNNFAVLTVAALAVLWYDPDVRPALRLAASAVLVSGVLMSASKTGAVTLAALALWRSLGIRAPRSSAGSPGGRRLLGLLAIVSAVLLALMMVPGTGIGAALTEASGGMPALDRIAPLFTDVGDAVAGSGSERAGAWGTALAIIWFSPVLGVGVGTYLEVAQALTGGAVLAHNTYLQILAEWGIPLALALFTGIAAVTTRRPPDPARRPLWGIGSTALLVLLVGSMGLSLNNSRVFWVLLGVTAATHLLSRPADSPASLSGEPR